jgi:hypothetical protein
MRTRGTRLVDSMVGTVQVDWLLIPTEECRDIHAENRVIRMHFRQPHEPWGHHGAFVLPVCIRRSRRRVLFFQQSGIEL